MGWLRYPRTPLEMLIAGTAVLAVAVLLFSIMNALYASAGAFAAAGGVLALIFLWDFAVERPKRRARRAAALAASNRPAGDIPLQTGQGAADWTERLPGPLGGIVRASPATVVALLIIGAAAGINGLLGDAIQGTRTEDSYVRLKPGAFGDIQKEGDRTESLRVTLLTLVERAERQNPELVPSSVGKTFWAAEVRVENIGTKEIAAPGWKLRASYGEYSPVSSDAPGEPLGDSFTLPRGGSRTGWVVFEIYSGETTQWLRARLPGYPSLYFRR